MGSSWSEVYPPKEKLILSELHFIYYVLTFFHCINTWGLKKNTWGLPCKKNTWGLPRKKKIHEDFFVSLVYFESEYQFWIGIFFDHLIVSWKNIFSFPSSSLPPLMFEDYSIPFVNSLHVLKRRFLHPIMLHVLYSKINLMPGWLVQNQI